MKLLSGPHLGAEVALDPGAYIVGSEDSCDLVLMDSSLA
ncbi:MAG: FHA domain-containing protein, partial [Thermodesulforhabdaceae bacterium]